MYSPTVHWSSQVIIGLYWFKTRIRQILETYGAALVKPCQVTAMLPFLGHCFQSQHHDPIHPENSNLGKMTQLRALHKKAIMSDLINIGMPEMREEGQLDTESYHVIYEH